MSKFNTFDLGACGCPAPMVLCGGCAIPANNLTIHIPNALLGNYTMTLVWDGVTTWTSSCDSNANVQYQFGCVAGSVSFEVLQFGSPGCISGTAPCIPAQTGLTCGSSFMATYTIPSGPNCNSLIALFYTGYTITNP